MAFIRMVSCGIRQGKSRLVSDSSRAGAWGREQVLGVGAAAGRELSSKKNGSVADKKLCLSA